MGAGERHGGGRERVRRQLDVGLGAEPVRGQEESEVHQGGRHRANGLPVVPVGDEVPQADGPLAILEPVDLLQVVAGWLRVLLRGASRKLRVAFGRARNSQLFRRQRRAGCLEGS